MFAERFDTLMNIAEVSNSQLGRKINLNPSYIGRLRSGARPLPKKHEYLAPICQYLARQIKKDYQINALQKLMGIDSGFFSAEESISLQLEQWLLEREEVTSEVTGRLLSGFSSLAAKPLPISSDNAVVEASQEYKTYLYGNAGKREAVEQFFMMILQENEPQTLLLFSDEDMAWLYEDPAFSAHWAELFAKVILKGNRVKMIHTVSRNMNEMLEAVTKWLPIYMTGMIEPYYYPRLRDGVFHRTLFIAPNTAAIISSSVQQNTEGMLNLFLTDKAALDALVTEYEHYFAMCRPLMRIYAEKDADDFHRISENLVEAEGNEYLCCVMPPLFAMPEKLVRELSEQLRSESLIPQWKRCFNLFNNNIKKQHLTLVLLDSDCVFKASDMPNITMSELFSNCDFTYKREQYIMHIEQLRKLEKQYENLKIHFVRELPDNTLIYVKESTGVIIAKVNTPKMAFVINDRSMINAIWDYIEQLLLP